MPKNLGLYNDSLSIPRKQDIDNVQNQVDILSNIKLTTPEGLQGQILGYVNNNIVGAIDLPSSSAGKRVCRFVVGTSTAGWTEGDCDYLCDGTDDQVEINAAIQALPSGGGEIVILDGTYYITATITMNKNNVKLSGNGSATVLERMWNSSSGLEGVITSSALNCTICQLYIEGNSESYTSSSNCGIKAYKNNMVTNVISTNNKRYGIEIASNYNIISNNIVYNNKDSGIHTNSANYCCIIGNISYTNSIYGFTLSQMYDSTVGNNISYDNNIGLYIFGTRNCVSNNSCNYNNDKGIHCVSSKNSIVCNTAIGNNIGILVDSDNCSICSNICYRGTGSSTDYTSSQYTINIEGNKNIIIGNMCLGKNITDSGSGNIIINNLYQ